MSYINKTINYLKRNGIKNTCYAVMERLTPGGMADFSGYTYEAPDVSSLHEQELSWKHEKNPIKFSICVPTYETPAPYLTALIDSVLAQSWGKFELILADASLSDTVAKIVELYEDPRILYHKLPENLSIAENTNAAVALASGDYIGFLDHDDLLTPDALYHMAKACMNGSPLLVYSDEDKCDEEAERFYEPHFKEDFNFDLFLTNNYICHFTMVKAEMMEHCKFRKEYDGAQDFDLCLQVVDKILRDGLILEEQIAHVPKVLYHWRCHNLSTADNPQSKLYAYEAGKCAIENFFEKQEIAATVAHSVHLGFYESTYAHFWQDRPDVAVVGGKIVGNLNKITSGMIDEAGHPCYVGLDSHFGGYMQRASMRQDATAVDVRCMKVRVECLPVFEEVFRCKVPKSAIKGDYFSTKSFWKNLIVLQECKEEEEILRYSLSFCEKLAFKGYRILFDPTWVVRL